MEGIASTEGNGTPATEGIESPAAEGSQGLLTQEQVNTLVGNARTKERAKYARYDEYKAAFEELEALKESQKTDLEKATSRADALQAELDALKAREQMAAWRAEVAQASGVPAEAISGATKEEMEAHAETLKKLFPQHAAPVVASDGFAPAAVPGGGTPREKFAAALEGML